MSNALDNVIVGEFLFEFESRREWINKALSWFNRHNATSATTVCVDNQGRLCNIGKHFMKADYPIRVYWLREKR